MTTTPAQTAPAPPRPVGAAPASGARRLGALLIDVVLIAVVYCGATAVGLAAGLPLGSVQAPMATTVVSGLCAIALAAAMTAWLWARGRTPGHRLLGLRWAAQDGAGSAGARSVGWYILAVLIGPPTLGVATILTLLITDPQGRNWIDRVCGTVVVAARPDGPAAPRAAGGAAPRAAGGASGPAPAFVEDTQEQPALTASQLRDRLGAAAAAGAADGPFAAPAAFSSAAIAVTEPTGVGPLFAPSPAPAGPAPAPAATLVMDTGQRIALVAPRTLLGRAPVAVAPWEEADTVPVTDPDRSISKTHLAVLLDGDRLSVRELGSTNGSAVVGADGARTTLLMGQDVVVPDGARIELGDRSFTVER
ncbi:RDD family protein [Actinomyces sp. oral taxon 414]|uniref:RDD family protein n=1 Tax=Actinomyces sp. oral taxon 414 TaxID=712122 RepID=UPI0006AE83BF|nr:RDD family protein [Actinomyces sp. oral taxon 414]